MKPGAFKIAEGSIEINAGRETLELTVKNTGTRSIQIGSHFHFAEANSALSFDREKAIGMRLDIPSGTAIRIEPEEEQSVTLVSIAGNKTVYGLNGMTEGSLDEGGKEKTIKKLTESGWMTKEILS
ncbi:urease subunit beta [Alkalihalophilus marmarensis]|uniref:urease subunit beta n=1 Tax=Alkalihalophilus marmarensis TaxID=521377 RepID=UPI002DB9A945|nr:urease subunit beta [Alkalihalophilus marmarensis]MEC2071053.1 urease subunit beta [Alkalihalophilus marmarensis]